MSKVSFSPFLLSEQQLDAFYAVAQSGSFTKATKILNLSQPALSRRIMALENSLELNLLDRTPQGISLTEAGQKILKYIQNKKALEADTLDEIRQKNTTANEYAGMIRIAGHSSVIEPIVMPVLANFLIENPNVQVELSVKDNAQLDEILNYSKADIIICNREMQKKDVMQKLLGYEEYVCIESDKLNTRSNVYLDVSPQDSTTEHFFEIQSSSPKKYKRSFMHDENGILRGVQLGIGRAIKPKHTIEHIESVKIVKGFTSLKRPVFIRYHKKQYYSKLEEKVQEILIQNTKAYLK